MDSCVPSRLYGSAGLTCIARASQMRTQYGRIARPEDQGFERACHTVLTRFTSCRNTSLRFSLDVLSASRAVLIVGTSFMIVPSRCSGADASSAKPVGDFDSPAIRLTLSNSL